MTRKEAYKIIKDNGWNLRISVKHNRSYTNLPTETLIHEIEQLKHKCNKKESFQTDANSEFKLKVKPIHFEKDNDLDIIKIKRSIIQLVSFLLANNVLDRDETDTVLDKIK